MLTLPGPIPFREPKNGLYNVRYNQDYKNYNNFASIPTANSAKGNNFDVALHKDRFKILENLVRV
jgi:hypothetical protein